MDIRALLKQGSSLEELEQSLLDLDSEFDFKCRHCGKCCKNQDTVLFTARDIYNIAKKLGKTTEHIIQECGEVSIGYSSRIPLVHMVPIGPQRRCPLLRDDGRCSVHDCKPTACALFPVGRVASIEGVLDKNMEVTKDCVKVRYVLNDFNCVTATGDGTVMTTIAVTRTSTTLNSLLLTFDIIHSSITSFHTLEPMFSSVRNFGFKALKL